MPGTDAPEPGNDGPQRLTVEVGDARPVAFVCAPGRYRLAVPLPRGAEAAVRVRLPSEIMAVEKARGSKALRILGWGGEPGEGRKSDMPDRFAKASAGLRRRAGRLVAVDQSTRRHGATTRDRRAGE